MMIKLSKKWLDELSLKPETGMGYQVVTVVLKDGKKFDHAVVTEGCITQVRGLKNIPFTEEQIDKLILTHEKWDFSIG